MSEWKTIAELADANPETLPANTDRGFAFQYIDLGSVDSGAVDWKRLQHFSLKEAPSRARRPCRPGDSLFGTVRPNLQSHGYVPSKKIGTLVASTGFTVIRPHQGLADGRYIYFSLLSNDILRQSVNAAVGSNYPAVTDRDVCRFRLFAPPVEQQSKIADVLEALDTQIQKTESLIAKLEKVKEGLLHDLLTRGIDENGQLRPSPEQAPELYKESPLGLIPKGWEAQPLGDLSVIVSGITLGGKSGSSTWPLAPYLRVANVQDGYLDLSEVKLIRVSPADVDKYRLLPGDVLMNEGGDFDKLGRGALWQGQIDLCLHQNHVFRVRTNHRILSPHFLTAFSASTSGKRYFIRSSKQSTNLASINSTQLKAFQVPLPSRKEQKLIVAELQATAARVEREKAYLGKLHIQKSGLTDDLLTGRVRVTSLLEQAEEATSA